LAVGAERTLAYPVVLGVACCIAGIEEPLARHAYGHAFTANLVSAGVRLIPLGQSDGLRVQAALEETARAVAEESAGQSLADLGTATWMVDWASARHETQYTRLFRS
jgi:urease accessory protein